MVPWCMTAWTEQSWTARRVSCLLNLYDSRTRSGAQRGFRRTRAEALYREIAYRATYYGLFNYYAGHARLARGSRPNRAVRGDRSPGPGNRPEPPAGASAA